MRTNSDIEEDVLLVARELARREGSTMGQVVSDLARRGPASPVTQKKGLPSTRSGVPVLLSRGEVVTLKHFQQLQDKKGIWPVCGLLDVNVIITLMHPDDAFHERAHNWWATNGKSGWASCPVTDNSVVHVMSNPGHSQRTRFLPGELISRLQTFASQTEHEFWPDDIWSRDDVIFGAEWMHNSRRINDLYLLVLAARPKGMPATFDTGIPFSAVRKANTGDLCVV